MAIPFNGNNNSQQQQPTAPTQQPVKESNIDDFVMALTNNDAQTAGSILETKASASNLPPDFVASAGRAVGLVKGTNGLWQFQSGPENLFVNNGVSQNGSLSSNIQPPTLQGINQKLPWAVPSQPTSATIKTPMGQIGR